MQSYHPPQTVEIKLRGVGVHYDCGRTTAERQVRSIKLRRFLHEFEMRSKKDLAM